jgi:hypothetical protein
MNNDIDEEKKKIKSPTNLKSSLTFNSNSNRNIYKPIYVSSLNSSNPVLNNCISISKINQFKNK